MPYANSNNNIKNYFFSDIVLIDTKLRLFINYAVLLISLDQRVNNRFTHTLSDRKVLPTRLENQSASPFPVSNSISSWQNTLYYNCHELCSTKLNALIRFVKTSFNKQDKMRTSLFGWLVGKRKGVFFYWQRLGCRRSIDLLDIPVKYQGGIH